MRAWCLVLLLLSLPAVPAPAQSPVAHSPVKLQDRLALIQSLQGEFRQELSSENGQHLESSSGQFRLLQPGFFSWHILRPDEQLLLATGKTLLHYDVELETATRREMAAGEMQGPLSILSGSGDDVALHYQIEQTAADTYRLTPLTTDAGFTLLILSFSGAVPARMEVYDQLLQTTVIEFSAMQLNPPLLAADFEFEPPAGVDLYYNER